MNKKIFLWIPLGMLAGMLLAKHFGGGPSVVKGTKSLLASAPPLGTAGTVTPAAPVAPVAPRPAPKLEQSLFEKLRAWRSYGENPQAEMDEQALAKDLQSLQAKELTALKILVLDPTQNALDRQTAVFLLTKKGLAAVAALSEISQSAIPVFEHLNNPHSAGTLAQKSELSLRVTALEALDQLAMQSAEVNSHLQKIAATQKDPTLAFLANISLAGIQEGRPGKLKRAIDAMIQEKGL